MAAAGGGPRFSAPPLTRLLPRRRRRRSRRGLSNRSRPAREALLAFPTRAVPVPRRPRCPSPCSVQPHWRPHYLSGRPGPTVRGPWARTGRPSSRSARPGERSAASSRAGVRGHSRAPFWPVLGPWPGRRRLRRRSRGRRGEWSRRRRRCRHGARPRGGGISPQAGSAPPASPRHLHPFPRSLPGSTGSPAERERERERGETGKNTPARVGRGSGRGGAEDRGAAAATGHRPRFGLTVAVRTRRGRGAETGLRRLRPDSPRPSPPRGEPGKRAGDVRV